MSSLQRSWKAFGQGGEIVEWRGHRYLMRPEVAAAFLTALGRTEPPPDAEPPPDGADAGGEQPLGAQDPAAP